MAKTIAIISLITVWSISMAWTQDSGETTTVEEKSVGEEASPASALEEEKTEIIIEQVDETNFFNEMAP